MELHHTTAPEKHGIVFGQVLSLLLSLGFTGLLSFYVFYYSYQLPAALGAPALKATAPDFTLSDQSGKKVTLSELRGKKVIIDFFRGNW